MAICCSRPRGRGCQAAERTQDSIEHHVEFPPHVFRQNTKDEVVVLLKELVLASVPSVRCSVREMLGAVQFDRDARIGAEQIDLQPTLAIEWNWERDVETKSPLGCCRSPKTDHLCSVRIDQG